MQRVAQLFAWMLWLVGQWSGFPHPDSLPTVNSALTNNVVVSGSTVTVDSFFDPQVEFLELGVSVNGARTWKVLGPDLAGGYGARQGVGGLEATVRESDGQTTAVISDFFGNTLATVPALNQVNWTGMRFGGLGPAPGFQPPPLSASTTRAESTLWRTRCVDPTAFYWSGTRFYYPVSGGWLSADPSGHGASWSLYDYCSNDPVNGLDPDGRLGKGGVSGISSRWDKLNSNSDGYQGDPDAERLDLAQESDAYGTGHWFGCHAPEIGPVVLPKILGLETEAAALRSEGKIWGKQSY